MLGREEKGWNSMPYESVDALQHALTRDVFHYAKDAKKAAGRALGTLVEIITFYLIKSWGYEKHTAIERHLPEYANPEITHNVEFSLHPSYELVSFQIPKSELPLTPRKLAKHISAPGWTVAGMKTTQLLTSDQVLRNACILYEDAARMIIAYLGKATKNAYRVSMHHLNPHPFAVLECKRVGVEEGGQERSTDNRESQAGSLRCPRSVFAAENQDV